MNRYARYKESHPLYIGLNRIEELFRGLRDMLVYMCKFLFVNKSHIS